MLYYSYLHHFYFADNFVDTARNLAETDCRLLDSDMTKEVVKIGCHEKFVGEFAD